eukprot:TRINITY_DN3211_c0_g1_i1.p1 TRINITY_DN3211_c0_g1~~TRINITY_DN3211_c0_g1_i1.p1  ORF type:complete len:547 (+),score=126.21 TRINITY_DN3211_c0_g1_i1:52-1692(+)
MEEDDFYYDNEDNDSQDDDDGGEGGSDFVNDKDDYFDDVLTSKREEKAGQNIKIMTYQDFVKEHSDSVSRLSSLLQLCCGQAELLLIKAAWSPETASTNYFEDSENFCLSAGVVLSNSGTPVTKRKEKKSAKSVSTCEICYEEVISSEMVVFHCGHSCCKKCINDHVGSQLASGMLPVKCLYSKCPAFLDDDILQPSLKPEIYKKFRTLIITQHINQSKRIKQCPNSKQECDRVIQLLYGDPPRAVTCDCGFTFCWECGVSDHQPITCSQIRKWSEKGADPDGKLTMMWVRSNTKKCPKCNKDILKNEGCNHMTCKCGYEFCWLCRGDWKAHGSHSGGFYSCNKYEASEAKKVDDIAAKEREDLKRYEHHFTRFFNYERDLKITDKKRADAKQKMEEFRLEGVNDPSSSRYGMNPSFILEGVELELQCRHLLMYSYIIAYFMDESGKSCDKDFFLFRQANLEGITERLAEMNSKSLKELKDDDLRANIRTTELYLKAMKDAMREAALDLAEKEKLKECATPSAAASTVSPPVARAEEKRKSAKAKK